MDTFYLTEADGSRPSTARAQAAVAALAAAAGPGSTAAA
jgi:polygalacturonase